MSYTTEMAVTELDAETAALLPERSAMAIFNFSNVEFWQSSFAGSIFGELPLNEAWTAGFVVVDQD